MHIKSHLHDEYEWIHVNSPFYDPNRLWHELTDYGWEFAGVIMWMDHYSYEFKRLKL